jgi:hypothetical protein
VTGTITLATAEGKTWEIIPKATKMRICFTIYEKRPFSIHLKVKLSDKPLGEGKKKRSGAKLIASNVKDIKKVSFLSITQYAGINWK